MKILRPRMRTVTERNFVTMLALLTFSASLATGKAHAQVTEATLPGITVRASPTTAQKSQLSATTESVHREEIAETINVVNTEDALKYLPSLILRKRNLGDQQAPLATRTSGVGQSARSLIYADGMLLSTLIGNNNGSASPRWGLVSPEEIERIDVMYGPFSAAYPGNSMGAVVEIVTRMPRKFEASVKAQTAYQNYSLYGTSDSYRSSQFSTALGSRSGGLSWWLSANHLDARSQPVAIVTAARPAAPSAAGTPVTGGIMDTNRLNQPVAVIGSGGLETKAQDTFKARLAYDFTPQWRAIYTIGVFQNDAKARAETYLRNAAGAPVYSGASLNINGYNFTNIGTGSFSSSSGFYNIAQEHTAQSLALRSNTRGTWDWEAMVSNMRYGVDSTRFPGTAFPAAAGGGAGTSVSLGGTGWSTLDLKAYWRPHGITGAHQVSFGIHSDQYRLSNTTYVTADWISGPSGAITANARGKTATSALWVQDAWRITDKLRLTLGGRQEFWRAFDGVNFSAAPASHVSQPTITSLKFSPKASIGWRPDENWKLTASYGTAWRFPTVTELYQAVTVSGVIFTPDPNLRPERAHSGELAAEYVIDQGRIRVSLFQENLADALISQNATIPGTTTIGASIQNIDRIRTRGIELVADRRDVLLDGLDLSGSVTRVASRILSNPGFRNAAGVLTDVTGKRTPNIPSLKFTGRATYRHDDRWSGSLGVRYSSRVWATFDNVDVNLNTWQGFGRFFVVDARLTYQFDRRTRAALGIENLNNRKYFLFHPFPQRTVMAELHHAF